MYLKIFLKILAANATTVMKHYGTLYVEQKA
jgi:hypothetical protein